MSGNESPVGPWVFANLAISLDGKIDSALREAGGFSSRFDRDRLDAFRAEADALIVGAGTVRAEDPPLGIRDPDRRAKRVAAGREEHLSVVVVSRSGDLPPGARFLSEPARQRLLALPRCVPEQALSPLRPSVESGTLAIVRCGEEALDLESLLSHLAATGHKRVLLEGGGEVMASFLERDLIDQVRVTLCPTLLGGRDAPTLVGGRGWPLAKRKKLHLAAVEQVGDELFLRYDLEK